MCKHGILQYTVVRPITTAISLYCEVQGVYGEGEFRPSVAYPYMVVINDISQFVAMYCLVLFYKANYSELSPMKPLPKFFCIKAVVFFSFFQGVVINFMFYFDVLHGGHENRQQLSNRLQDFLVCIEMCLAAIAHYYSFSYEQYDDSIQLVLSGNSNDPNIMSVAPSPSICRSFLASLDISDFHQDIQEHFSVVTGSISRKIRGKDCNQKSKTNVCKADFEVTDRLPNKSESLNKKYPSIYGSV